MSLRVILSTVISRHLQISEPELSARLPAATSIRPHARLLHSVLAGAAVEDKKGQENCLSHFAFHRYAIRPPIQDILSLNPCCLCTCEQALFKVEGIPIPERKEAFSPRLLKILPYPSQTSAITQTGCNVFPDNCQTLPAIRIGKIRETIWPIRLRSGQASVGG